jgi:hypothetical protein
MPTLPLTLEVKRRVLDLTDQGYSRQQIVKETGLSDGSIGNIRREGRLAPVLQEGKKVGSFDWREWSQWAESGQKLKSKASWSQEKACFSLGDGKNPIILATFSDQQIGDWGTDYSLFTKITEEIRDTPNLYLAMLGDESQHAIKLRSVLEVVSGSLIPPEQQEMFIEAWLKEIRDKIAFGCWSNHSVERAEKQAGSSVIKNLISRHAVYFNGIGHADIKVGEQTYRVAASHVFRGRSQFTANHGPRRYARHEGQDREIILQADLHTPELSVYYEGGKQRVAITCGSIQSNSGYAKRYFSLMTVPAYPCVVLDNKEHKMTPFWTIAEAVKFVG